MKYLISLFLIFCSLFSYSQNVGIGTQTPHPSAALEITDSSRGILIPRMTMTQRIAIQNPAEGLMVYQTDSIRGYWYWDGLGWKTSYNSNNVDSLINSLQSKGIRIGFSTSTTWVVPNDVHMITVELWGGGGGGGGGSASRSCSGWGGANGGMGGKGGYTKVKINVMPGQVCFIEIGIGGQGGVAGPASGTSIDCAMLLTPNWGGTGADGNYSKFNNQIIAIGGRGGIGGHISNCIKITENGLDGSVNNFYYPQNTSSGSRNYIPANFLTLFPTLASGGNGGAGQTGNCGSSSYNPTAGSNGEDGYCIISY